MNSLIRFDRRASLWFQGWPAELHPYMLAITQVGGVAFVVTVSIAIAVVAYTKHHTRLAIAFLAVFPGELLNATLKLLFNRVRPDTLYAHSLVLHTKSFPSGHAFGSMMLYGMLAYLAYTRLPHGWNWFVASVFGLLIVLIGISRIYLGAHYFLDVIAGWGLGFVILLITIKLTKI